MPDSDRLQELNRQRGLVQEQLAWLDREIAALNGPKATSIVSAQAAVILARDLKPVASSPIPAVTMAELAAATGDSDVLLNQLMAEEKKAGEFSKQGCWAIFLGVMITVGLVVSAIGYFFYR